jgi:hypothetical protein
MIGLLHCLQVDCISSVKALSSREVKKLPVRSLLERVKLLPNASLPTSPSMYADSPNQDKCMEDAIEEGIEMAEAEEDRQVGITARSSCVFTTFAFPQA